MAFDFTDKVVLVTGATSGIGRDTALRFAKAGAKVVITGRREDKGREVLAELQQHGSDHLYVKADASSDSDTRALFDQIQEKYGRLDVAFNNAGIEDDLKPLTEVEEAGIDRTLAINVKGVILSLKYEIPLMEKGGGGSIINMSSIAGLIGFPGASVYTASKFAVTGLTKAAALETAKKNIRVNAVGPGPIETDMLQRFSEQLAGGDINNIGAMTPFGRVAKVHEVSETVLFLASDAASYITGQTLAIDGGYVAG